MLKHQGKSDSTKDTLTFHNASEIGLNDGDFIYDNDEEDDEEDDDEDDDEEEIQEGENGTCIAKKRKPQSTSKLTNSLLKKKKKTKGRVKINMEFIEDKTRRYTTFSKRKTGIMKKAYELSTLTGTQVMLLVASETGHVYTFATEKLQPMITSDAGKSLIQSCLSSNSNEEETSAENAPTLPISNEENTSND